MKPLIAIVVLQVTASVLALPKGNSPYGFFLPTENTRLISISEMAKRDVDSGFGLGWNDKWMIIRGDGSTSDDERAGFMSMVLVVWLTFDTEC